MRAAWIAMRYANREFFDAGLAARISVRLALSQAEMRPLL
jgi:hypothetical protein